MCAQTTLTYVITSFIIHFYMKRKGKRKLYLSTMVASNTVFVGSSKTWNVNKDLWRKSKQSVILFSLKNNVGIILNILSGMFLNQCKNCIYVLQCNILWLGNLLTRVPWDCCYYPYTVRFYQTHIYSLRLATVSCNKSFVSKLAHV